MADYYLNKIGSKIQSVQGRQVMRLLEKKRQIGEFRTLDDLRNKLKELTTDLLEKRIKPTFRLWVADGGKDISSEKFNDMMEYLEQDLETIFVEADNLYDILDTHNFLIKEVALRNIEAGLNNLEAQVSLYEFLIDTEDGFDEGVFNTFRDSSGSFVDESLEITKFLFVDHRTKKTIPPKKRAVVDIVGEQLVMSMDQEEYITLRNAVHLGGPWSTRSELIAFFPDVSISNIIDNTVNTYWATPILLVAKALNGAFAEIAVDLPSSQDVTFVEIEPASPKPMILQSLSYLDSSKQIRNISITETVLNKEKIKVSFDRINTSKIFFRFQQKNFHELQFKKGQLSNVSQTQSSSSYQKPGDISQDEDVAGAISSPFLADEILGLKRRQSMPSERYYEYIIALDNIKVGRNQYHDISIFASSQKAVPDLRQIALRVSETRPVEVFSNNSSGVAIASHSYPARSTTENERFYHGSIEYNVVVELLDSNKVAEATAILPVLPLDAQRIYHEYLVFTNRISTTTLLKDSGSLRFFCDADSTDVVVYKNGLPLSYSADWDFIVDGHATDLTEETPNTGVRMKRGIQILTRIQQSDIYTVSYTPKKSTSFLSPASGASLLSAVDLVGDLSFRMTPNGTIIVEPEKFSSTIVNANVYLTILMRRNSQNNTLSPTVEEFLLAVGSKDENKYTKETV